MDDRTNFFVGWRTLTLINAGLAQAMVGAGCRRCNALAGPM